MKDWEEMFSDTKLVRGWDYYEGDCVKSLEKTFEGYHAVVEGMDNYNVYIYSQDDEYIDEMSCECPDFCQGHNCKHLAAVLYAIDDFQEGKEFINEDNCIDDVKEIIDSLSETELRNYLKKIIKNKDILNDFRFSFLEAFKDSGLKEEICEFYRKYRNTYRYYDDNDFTSGSRKLLKKIKILIEHQRLEEAFKCINVAMHCLNSIEIDDFYDEYHHLIFEMIALNNKKFNDMVFNWCLKMFETNHNDVKEIFENLILQAQYHQMALTWVDEQLDKGIVKNLYLEFKYASLKGQARTAFVKKYYNYDIIKKLYVDDLINKQKYFEAVKVLKDLRDNYTNDEYTEKIIRLSNQAGLVEEAIQEAKNWLYQSASIKKYVLLKKLYGQEWLNHREAVLTKLRIQGINLENYYCEEMMIDELYQEVKDDYERFYENRNFLKDKYSKELTEKTIDHIFYLSRNTGSREKYYHIASLVKSLLQYGNDDTLIKRIVLTLMKKYPNRPAFKQELAKILR